MSCYFLQYKTFILLYKFTFHYDIAWRVCFENHSDCWLCHFQLFPSELNINKISSFRTKDCRLIIKLVTSSMEFSLTHGEAIVKNDDNYVNLDHVRVKKVNRTHHLIIGNLTLFINQGNEYQFYGLLYKKQGNEYKKTPYKMGPKKFCDFLSGEKLFYPSIHATSDFPSIGTCPWPKVSYDLLNYLSDFPQLFHPRISIICSATVYNSTSYHQPFPPVTTW